MGSEEEEEIAARLKGQECVLGELVEECDPFGEWCGGNRVWGVALGEHGVVGRVAEDQIAAVGLGWEAGADVVFSDIGASGVKVVGKAAASHGLADVDRGATTGHGIDYEVVGSGEIMESVGDDGRWDRARMRDSEGAIVAEGPDVVGCRLEVGTETMAPP